MHKVLNMILHSSNRHARKFRGRRRRGAALILAVALLFTLFSFLAFSIDTGYLAASRAELRRTADSSALAGAWSLYEELVEGHELNAALPDVMAVCSSTAASNVVCSSAPQLLTSGSAPDVQVGYLADLGATTQLSSNSSDPYFAVQVAVKRTGDRNGEVPFFFGKIFGFAGRPMDATATAVMARSIGGFNTPGSADSSLNVLPFALDQQTWNAIASGQDQYAYNATTGTVTSGSDGIKEVNLYPQGTGSPGNRGTVDIGGANNSTADIARQIVYGISAEDIADLGKELKFDTSGQMTLNGDTGISAGVKDELASIIGKTRIIPIFSHVCGNGNNANYTIVKWAGVRILGVKLTGSMSQKHLTVQPAPVISRDGIVSASTASSNYVFSPVMLAR